MEFTPARPGSVGEHELQQKFGTTERADRFYSHQMLDHLNDRMQIFVGRQEMIFISSSDAHGECDCSFRAGPPGFVRVLDENRITWPEYRGNGVLASAGNISENPHVGVLMIDFVKDVIGLHVNGKAELVADDEMRQRHSWLIEDDAGGRSPERWIVVHVEEAYVHCSKHIPRMVRVPMRRSVGTGESRRELKRKGGDYFAARGSQSPWKESLDPEGRRAAEPVGAFEACGVDLPDPPAEQRDDEPTDPQAPAASADPAFDEDDGSIWGQLTMQRGALASRDAGARSEDGRGSRHRRQDNGHSPWDPSDRSTPDSNGHSPRDPLAAAAAAAAEGSAGQTHSAAQDHTAVQDHWDVGDQNGTWEEPSWTAEGSWSSGGGNGWHADTTDEAERPAYVGSDATASLLFGVGPDDYQRVPSPHRPGDAAEHDG